MSLFWAPWISALKMAAIRSRILHTPPQNAATPVMQPSGGTFTSGQSVSIGDSTAGATNYYTIDGSVPTTASQVDAGSFLLPQLGCGRPGHGHCPRIFGQCCRHGRFQIPDSGRNLSYYRHRNGHSHGLQQDAAAESDSVDSDRQLITEQKKPGEDFLPAVSSFS
jgi:hypothetical protein